MRNTRGKGFSVFVLILGFLVTGCQTATTGIDRVAENLRSLQGYWEGTGPGNECSVTISGNSLSFYARDDHWYDTTFEIVPGTDPMQLHATVVQATSSGKQHIGTVVEAIFEVDQRELRLATSEDVWAPKDGDPWERYADHYEFKKGQPKAGKLRERTSTRSPAR